jgi:hypothetical protein
VCQFDPRRGARIMLWIGRRTSREDGVMARVIRGSIYLELELELELE